MEKYPNADNQFRLMNNMPLNAQGEWLFAVKMRFIVACECNLLRKLVAHTHMLVLLAKFRSFVAGPSSLSVNAPEFVPGGGGGPPILVRAFPGHPQEWAPRIAPHPGQFNQAPQGPFPGPPQAFTPQPPPHQFAVAPQAIPPPPHDPSYAAMQQRMAHMSINDRLRPSYQGQPAMQGELFAWPRSFFCRCLKQFFDLFSLLLSLFHFWFLGNNQHMSNGLSSRGFGGGPPHHVQQNGHGMVRFFILFISGVVNLWRRQTNGHRTFSCFWSLGEPIYFFTYF